MKIYEIKVKIKNTQDTACYLAYYYDDQKYIEDTSYINTKGEFVFSGEDTLGGGIYLIVTQNKTYFEIIIHSPKIQGNLITYLR